MIRDLRSRPATREATLETRIRDLEQQLARVPARWAGGGGAAPWQPVVVRVLGGNEVAPDALPGVKKAASVLAAAAFEASAGVWRNPGSRATAGTVTRSSGVITAVAVGDGGAAYKAVADMTAAERDCMVTGGGGTGAQVRIGTVDSNGVVTGFEVVAGGSGYTTNPTIIAPYPTGVPAGLPWPDGVGYGEIVGLDSGELTRVVIAHDGAGPLQFALLANQRIAISGYRAVGIGAVLRAVVPLWI